MNPTKKLLLNKILLILLNLCCLILIIRHSAGKYMQKTTSDKKFMGTVFLSTMLFFVNGLFLMQFNYFDRFRLAVFQRKLLVILLILTILVLYFI